MILSIYANFAYKGPRIIPAPLLRDRIKPLPRIMSLIPFRITLLFLLAFATSFMVTAQKRSVSCRIDSNGRGSVDLPVYLYEEVDEQPAYPGGEREMMKFIIKERRYPEEAYNAGVQGRVLCSFIVQPDGSVSYVEVLRGVEKSLNDEAVRIITNMPKWTPGKVEGTNVPTYCILPISFRK